MVNSEETTITRDTFAGILAQMYYTKPENFAQFQALAHQHLQIPEEYCYRHIVRSVSIVFAPVLIGICWPLLLPFMHWPFILLCNVGTVVVGWLSWSIFNAWLWRRFASQERFWDPYGCGSLLLEHAFRRQYDQIEASLRTVLNQCNKQPKTLVACSPILIELQQMMQYWKDNALWSLLDDGQKCLIDRWCVINDSQAMRSDAATEIDDDESWIACCLEETNELMKRIARALESLGTQSYLATDPKLQTLKKYTQELRKLVETVRGIETPPSP